MLDDGTLLGKEISINSDLPVLTICLLDKALFFSVYRTIESSHDVELFSDVAKQV